MLQNRMPVSALWFARNTPSGLFIPIEAALDIKSINQNEYRSTKIAARADVQFAIGRHPEAGAGGKLAGNFPLPFWQWNTNLFRCLGERVENHQHLLVVSGSPHDRLPALRMTPACSKFAPAPGRALFDYGRDLAI